jgi:hypothetical protein
LVTRPPFLLAVPWPSDAREYRESKTIEVAALELTRQIFYPYDPDTTRFQRVPDVAASHEPAPDRMPRPVESGKRT